ncbi:MAG: hypothetical protein NT121_04975 [Chloroflexi bacterium]|nr:hypothetical protein [Chloroflexota bacterium]
MATSLPLLIVQAEFGQIRQMTLFGEMVAAQVGWVEGWARKQRGHCDLAVFDFRTDDFPS